MDEVFDVKETAEYLHCSQSTVRKLMRNNKIPYFRIAYRIFFKKEALDEWVDNECTVKCKEKIENEA